jgi:hypothetical protein
MRTAMLAAAVGVLLLVPTSAWGQTSGLTCTPVAAQTESSISCTVTGLAPASQFSWSVTLPGTALTEGAGVAGTDGSAAFTLSSGSQAGAYLASVTGTAAGGAGFSAEVSGTVAAAAPTGPVAAGFGPGVLTLALAAGLLVLAAGFVRFAIRPARPTAV